MTRTLNRRAVLIGLPLLLAGCASAPPQVPQLALQQLGPTETQSPYGSIANEPYPVRALDLSKVDPDLLRQQVAYSGPYAPGTVVVSIPERRLYLVQPGGSAIRYAVGVGRDEALNFRGSAVIGRKAEWPTWTPTASMIQSIPRYQAYAGGMPGGADNPLGPCALYLYRDNQDTHFRLHGTTEPRSIGKAVSSGCIRLFNQDIIDLYNRVPVGAPLVVLQG
jgi:lipoprotein-anchoring transpeptidase ErfK/SrfK